MLFEGRKTMTHPHAIARNFVEPIAVFGALGFVHHLRTVDETHAFLAECPASRADASYHEAIAACRSVFAGKTDAEAARQAFCRFAQKAGILDEEIRDHLGTVFPAKRSRGTGVSPADRVL